MNEAEEISLVGVLRLPSEKKSLYSGKSLAFLPARAESPYPLAPVPPQTGLLPGGRLRARPIGELRVLLRVGITGVADCRLRVPSNGDVEGRTVRYRRVVCVVDRPLLAPGVVPNAYREVVVGAGSASRVPVPGDREGCPWLAV